MTRTKLRMGAAAVVGALLASTLLAAPVAGAVDGSAQVAATPEGGPFEDVARGHPFFGDVSWLAGAGITEGYLDGTFGSTQPVTRQAMAAFLHRFAEGPDDPAECESPPFPDVDVDHPFCAEISWLLEQGMTTGFSDGTFGGEQPVTRQAMAAFLHRQVGAPEGDEPVCVPDGEAPFVDVPTDHPFCPEIDWLATARVAVGFAADVFGTDVAVTRQAMAAFLHRLHVVSTDPPAPVPSAGCGTSTAVPSVKVRVDVDVNGVDRWFFLSTPPNHNGTTPVPLVVDYHGLSEGANIHTMMSAYSDEAMQRGFAVAFPQGTGSPVRWNVGADETNPDLDFVDAILDTLGEQLCLDESRIYAIGLSFGAFMTSRLACSRSDRFAAVSMVAGVVMPDPCPTERAVPLLAFHGTDDAILRYDGGVGDDYAEEQAAAEQGEDQLGGAVALAEEPPRAPVGVDLSRPFPEQVALWAAQNGCMPTPTDTQITDEVIHRVYRCPIGSSVEFYIVLGGGHSWPGSTFSRAVGFAMGYTTFDIVATELSWQFFQRHRLPAS